MSDSADNQDASQPGFMRPLLLYAVATFVMIGPFVLPATRIDTTSYDSHDSAIFLWNFWWTKTAVLSGRNPYWTDTIFYPTGTSLVFHSFPLPHSLATIPIQMISPGPDGLAICFNLIVFASYVLSGFAAYRLALYVTGSCSGAIIAGLFYTFIPYHLLNAPRLHVLAIEFLPFYVLAQLRLEASPNLRNSIWLGFWLALNYYTSLEYALFLVLFSCARCVWLMCVRRRWLTWDYTRQLFVAGTAFVVLAGPLIYQQWQVYLVEWQSIERSFDEAAKWSPAVASFVTPSRLHPAYGDAFAFAGTFRDGTNVGMRSETTLNFTVLVLAAIAIFGAKRDGRLFWLIAFFMFLSFSLGPYLRITGTWQTKIPMPWLALYETVPPFRGGREPARFFPLAMLMISLPAAMGVQRLCSIFSSAKGMWIVTTGLALLVLFEDLTRWPAERIELNVDPFYERLANETGDFTIMDLTPEFSKLIAQPVHGRKMVDWRGFIVRSEMAKRPTPFVSLQMAFKFPEHLLQMNPAERGTLLDRYRHVLRNTQVKYLLLPADGPTGQIELAEELGVEVWRESTIIVCRIFDMAQ